MHFIFCQLAFVLLSHFANKWKSDTVELFFYVVSWHNYLVKLLNIFLFVYYVALAFLDVNSIIYINFEDEFVFHNFQQFHKSSEKKVQLSDC